MTLPSSMKDRGNHVVLGTFIATFVYCLLVLRTVSESPEPFVPHFGVTAGLVLALASLVVLIYFIHHVARTLQADYIIGVVAHELDHAIVHLYPGGMGEDAPPERLAEMKERERELRNQRPARVSLPASGYVHALDVDLLMKLAVKHDLVVRILSRPGHYVHDGTAVAEVWPAASVDEAVEKKVRSAFMLGRTRTSQQDVEFAVNQLVEVAARALSPRSAPATPPMWPIERAGGRGLKPALHQNRVRSDAHAELATGGGSKLVTPAQVAAWIAEALDHGWAPHAVRARSVRRGAVLARSWQRARREDHRWQIRGRPGPTTSASTS